MTTLPTHPATLPDAHTAPHTPPPADAPAQLVLDGLVKLFADRGGKGRVAAVQGVSLGIPRGEFVTLLGPSGCGKTTTLRLIAGFETPTQGRILLDGQDITLQPPNKRDMTLVFQNYALFPHMSVFDNVAYGLYTRGAARHDVTKAVQGVMALIGLDGLAQRRPNQLSGGQQQRVALARALVMEPRILLFDEPLSNLDAKLRVQMRSDIHRLQRRLGITSVYVTHDQVEAMAMSDRIVVMNQGHIEQVGTPSEIYRCPATRFVADFIGRANFIDGVPYQRTADGRVALSLLGQPLHLTARLPLADDAPPTLTAMIRPEALALHDDPALPQGTVEQAMYLGAEAEYLVQLDDALLTVVVQNPREGQLYREGARVGVALDAAAVHLLPGA